MPTTDVVMSQRSYTPGVSLFGPVLVPDSAISYTVAISREFFSDPATAMLAWVDFSIDGGATWLGDALDPVPTSHFTTLGLTPQRINHYTAIGDKGNAAYPTRLDPRTGAIAALTIRGVEMPGRTRLGRQMKGGLMTSGGTFTTKFEITWFP